MENREKIKYALFEDVPHVEFHFESTHRSALAPAGNRMWIPLLALAASALILVLLPFGFTSSERSVPTHRRWAAEGDQTFHELQETFRLAGIFGKYALIEDRATGKQSTVGVGTKLGGNTLVEIRNDYLILRNDAGEDHVWKLSGKEDREAAESEKQQSCTIRGVIKDQATDTPLANAWVAIVLDHAGEIIDWTIDFVRTDKEVIKVNTDEKGCYEATAHWRGSEERVVTFTAGATYYYIYPDTTPRGGIEDINVLLLKSGQVTVRDIELKKALFVEGTVVDTEGKQIPGVTVAACLEGVYGIPRTVESVRTDLSGKFLLDRLPRQTGFADDTKSVCTVFFEGQNHLPHVLENVYELSEAQRSNLKIVLKNGCVLSGTVFDSRKRPVSNVAVTISGVHEQTQTVLRRYDMTGDNGEFFISGLPEGEIEIIAHSLELKEKTKLQLNVTGESLRQDLYLTRAEYSKPENATKVLGLSVIALDEELRELYDISDSMESGLVILDAAADHERLAIGKLEAGCCLWLVGDSPVTSLKQLVEALIRNYEDKQNADHSTRVVYTKNNPTPHTNTQYIKLTEQDVVDLKALLPSLK